MTVVKFTMPFEEGVSLKETFENENPGTLANCPMFAFVPKEGDRKMKLSVYFPSMVSRFTLADFEAALVETGIEYRKDYVKGDVDIHGKESRE